MATNFAHIVYVLPTVSTCQWAGMGYVGCDGSFECRAWIGGRRPHVPTDLAPLLPSACTMEHHPASTQPRTSLPYHLPPLPAGNSWSSVSAYMHEQGHNQYLQHSGAMVGGTFDVYADWSDSMGYCCSNRCYNTPHAWQVSLHPVASRTPSAPAAATLLLIMSTH